MFKKLNDKARKRLHRKVHIRKTVYGTAARPRLTVTRSNCNLYAQVINDEEGVTLASISTLEKEFAGIKPNVEGAAKITTVVFDRNGYLYHGVVKALADGTRKAGIIF